MKGSPLIGNSKHTLLRKEESFYGKIYKLGIRRLGAMVVECQAG
jgi:hypothetical protein